MSNQAFVRRLRSSGGPSHELLVLLDAHRVLTTNQLARATGAPVRTVRHRLDRLRTAGLIDAVRPGRESGSAPRHWWLRTTGARLVTGTAAAPGRQRPSGLHVAHAAAIADMWLAVRDHGPAAGLTLRRWWSDRAGWQTWETRSPGWGTRTRRLTPDAALLVDVENTDGTGTAAAFVEIDLATMTQAVLRDKVTRYLAYAADRAWQDQWPHCPPLLLLTTTDARAATFLAAARKMLAAARRDHQAAGGQAWRDIADANSLVVAACGLVRDPTAAIDAPVWLLPDHAATRASLPQLLAGRITAQTRARHHYDQAAAAAHRRDRIDQLGAIHDAADEVARLLDAPATEHLLARWYPATQPDLHDQDGELVDTLLAWWTNRDDPNLTHQARTALLDRHTAAWTKQAKQLLAAAERHGDHPRLRAAATTLADGGRLLDTWMLDELHQPPPRSWAQVQAAALEGYQAARDDEVTAVRAHLPWRARRHTTLDQLTAEHDREHLLICDTCAITYPRPDPDGEHRRDDEVCPHCHTGTPLPYEQRDQVATLDQRLTAIRARLHAASVTPPPRPRRRVE
ncbi:Replication-relaxation [Micromonospora purpureochromogenes]|uniref:Replication-relaxation n=1 Tax=Micromonospora purpureochromogenes TaxID=47872 RepID=A0A1C4UBG5_9ACTN|nr:replication-relaxation family protein [Micromonospora purpureochromogenes]SCE68992.1 Replication-relaxation [Micromonospora purpureochromogenes]